MFKDKKLKISPQVLFYLAFALYVAQSMLRWAIGAGSIRQIMSVAVILLLFVVFLCSAKKFTFKEVFLKIALILLSLITALVSKDYAMLYLAIFISTAKNLDFPKLIKVDLITKTVMLHLVGILYRLGMTEQVIMNAKNGGSIYAFGFGNPNTFSVYVFSICADLIFLNHRRKSKFIYLAAIMAAVFIDIFCDSRSSVICILLMTVVSAFSLIRPNKKYLKMILTAVPIICFVLTLLLVWLYNTQVPFALSLNTYLSKRIALASAFLDGYGVNLFGHYLENYHTVKAVSIYNILDSAYPMLLVRFGAIATAAVLLGISRQISSSYDKKDFNVIAGLLVFSIFGLMENGLFVLFYNPFLLSMSSLIEEHHE